MGSSHFDGVTTRRAMGAWLAVWLLLWQTAASAGLIERPMSSVETAAGALVICTEHGAQSLPGSGAPGQQSSDHSAPSCPCCLPFSPGSGGAILASSIALPMPAWVDARTPPTRVIAALPRETSSNPQQPRAPPLSI